MGSNLAQCLMEMVLKAMPESIPAPKPGMEKERKYR